MPQTCLRTETEKSIALKLQRIFESTFEDDGFPISSFEDLDNPVNWELAVYVETELAESVHQKLVELASEAGHQVAFTREDLEDIDWVAETLRELSSVRAGRYIVHGSHEKHIPQPNDIAICIDAGLAFGTGHHGTTAGCLDMLTRVSKKRQFTNILDLGTGSGVLAIAAAKTHIAHVLATDIDPVATETATYNVALNGCRSSVECITSTGFNHRRFGEQAPFDLIIANILAKPLQSMARDLGAHAESGATIILSGLLPHQRAAIQATFRSHGLRLDHYHIRDNWLTVVLEKPNWPAGNRV